MSQQGGRPAGHGDDWWAQLYDDVTEDTGATATPDTLDDRFASAAGTLGPPPAPPTPPPPDPVPPQRHGPPGRSDEAAPPPDGALRPGADAETLRRTRPRAPWEPPPSTPAAPATFPPGPMPPGFTQRAPGDRTTSPGAAPSAPSDADTAAGSADAVPPSSWPAPPGFPPLPGGTAPAEGPSAPRGPARSDAAGGSVPGAGARAGREDDAEPAPPAGDRPPAPGPGRAAGAAPPPPGGPTPQVAPGPAGDPGVPAEPAPRADPAPRVPAPPTGASPAPAPASASVQQAVRTATCVDLPAQPAAPPPFVGSRPPTYDAEPTALPPADPDELGGLVADTVLDGARYGACALRAVSVRGDSARYRGELRRDSLLTARFGTGDQALVLVAMATGARATAGAHRAAAEACRWIGRAVGRSHARLVEDIRAARREDLKSGLHRLTDRSLKRLRASAAEQGLNPEEYAATLRCLLLPADPECRIRVFFGAGAGGLFRLRDGDWRDIEPPVGEVAGEPVVGFGSPPAETPEGDRLTMDLGVPTPPSPYEPAPEPPREPFRFRASVARPGDVLLMCTAGLAEPLRGEAELSRYLAGRWAAPAPPGLAAYLSDIQVRVKGYADDRTAAAVWEA
ncbi:protein phosphatase 2C domain-containing protein [Streptomyces actuosus]|uniref:Protein phosphatase 2C domain-containing protein n=1 Tax=Streptomyces actuosus TaxID=1885 RepID=A0ABS2VNF0_STRAS|nr:protein phosphatase 2C domain-containing protein [Streptomyces actuosus]MBN0044649.1 protein phosphatase 2C domain-containing protein [Streptomyces actuosus]